MKSIRELYRIGVGPSSSHTMGPKKAADEFYRAFPNAIRFRVTLFGSLASTGRGHLTDQAVQAAFTPKPVEIIWQPNETLPRHPNGMRLEALGAADASLCSKDIYSIGGGALQGADGALEPSPEQYEIECMQEILTQCAEESVSIWSLVEQAEGKDIWPFLRQVWGVMKTAVERGLQAEGMLPGGLRLPRKALCLYQQATHLSDDMRRTARVSAYALAVAEENASSSEIVTAPTCGSCGVVPAVIYYLQERMSLDETTVLRALATAGMVGNIVKHNASISGAEVGCQGEIGTACAMAAAAGCQILGGFPPQIEYAAEMALEHHLGLTCDPVMGLVQIPCIERNAFAATRALSCAEYALLSDGQHRISFDTVVETMGRTGHDLPSLYRETGEAGLAATYRPNTK